LNVNKVFVHGLATSRSSTEVEHFPRHPKVKKLSPATAACTGCDKIAKEYSDMQYTFIVKEQSILHAQILFYYFLCPGVNGNGWTQLLDLGMI